MAAAHGAALHGAAIRAQQREQQEQLQLMRVANERPKIGGVPMPGKLPDSMAQPKLEEGSDDDTDARVDSMLNATRLASSRAKTLAALSGESRTAAEMSPAELRAYAAELRERAASFETQSEEAATPTAQPQDAAPDQRKPTADENPVVVRLSGVQRLASSPPIRVAKDAAGGALAGGQRLARALSWKRQPKQNRGSGTDGE